jgi:hypothetical protein
MYSHASSYAANLVEIYCRGRGHIERQYFCNVFSQPEWGP